VKGIKVYSKQGSGLLQRGDNHKNVKMGWGLSKIFLGCSNLILCLTSPARVGLVEIPVLKKQTNPDLK
jgi:hypothetical protein